MPPSYPRSVVAISGASGFIGGHLVRSLRSAGHRVVTIDRRRSTRQQTMPGDANDSLTWSELERCGLPDGVDAVCCLSGRSLLETGPALRLSAAAYRAYVDELFDSRLGRIRCLWAAAAGGQPKPPRRLVGVSAVGFYPSSLGTTPPPVYDEYYTGPADSSLAGRLCAGIEAAIFDESPSSPSPSNSAARRVAVRMGVALGRDGGALASMAWPFRLGLGGPVASGRQPVAWVHISDAVGVLEHAMLADLPLAPPAAPSAAPTASRDVLNAVAPALNTSSDLAAALASSLNRPAIFPTPGAVVRLMFGADRATVLTDGAFVAPRRTQETGYKFRFNDLRQAMRDLYGS